MHQRLREIDEPSWDRMKISIGVCTWNRCELLRVGLEAMTHLAIPTGVTWEVLVVNNNCTDATDSVVRSFEGRLPIRGLFEATPGKSNALNKVIREATGECILWTDDDTRVDEGWVAAYCRAFERWPAAVVFGGAVDPWFEDSPPAWLSRVMDRIGSAYALRDFGTEPVSLADDVVPFGANMAVRRDVQARYIYDASLGPRPGSPLRGEETTIVRRMLSDGLAGWWIPDARVRHFIPKSRQRVSFVREFFFGQGLRDGMELPVGRDPELFGVPRYLWRQALESEARYRIGRLIAGPDVWIQDLAVAAQAWGQMSSYAARRRAAEAAADGRGA
jgi:glycosyltransferase involved in cell wall biosynthesis